MRSALTFVAVSAAVAALATVTACATPNLDDPTPLPLVDPPAARGRSPSASSSSAPVASGGADGISPAPSGSGSSAPAPAPAPAPAAVPDAGADARQWKGALSATTPALFGGGAECRYRITLQQVKVDIVAAADGDIVAANVTAVAFEEVLSTPCSNVAIPAHTHTYALVTASFLSNGERRLELAGLSTNHPAASLVIEGDFQSSSPVLSLAWHRTDYGPPLDWRVTAQISVQAY
jgi:hypothetical protein